MHGPVPGDQQIAAKQILMKQQRALQIRRARLFFAFQNEFQIDGQGNLLSAQGVSIPRASSISTRCAAFFWMFGVSLAMLGIERNSLSSRMMRSSLSMRYSRTSWASCAGDGGVDFCANAGYGKKAINRVTTMFLKVPLL